MPDPKDKSLLEKTEDVFSDSYDYQRKQIPPWDDVGRVEHDIKVGIMKGVYGGAKSLIGGAIDLLRFAFDPQAQQAFGQKAWPVAVKLAKETYISKFGTPAEIQDQNERATAFAKEVYTKVRDSFSKDWKEAGKTEGKRTELATKWVSRSVFEIAALFVGAGEAKAALKGGEVVGEVGKLEEGAAILEEVTQPCKTVIMSNEEILAEQALKEAAAAKEAADAAKAAKVAADAEKVGMKTEHVEALVADCAERDRLAVYRKSNPGSLKYHGEKAARAKPHEVEVLKTAKAGEKNAGLVVRPKNPNAKELAEIKKLEDAGWTFDEEGRLLDPDKNMVHGDYDMQGIYKEVGTDAQGKPIYEKVDTNSESSYFLEDQNEMITPERDMHQHGANDNYTKTGPNGEKVMGRTPGADETYLVVDKNGTQVVESTAELQKVYEANNIPWPY